MTPTQHSTAEALSMRGVSDTVLAAFFFLLSHALTSACCAGRAGRCPRSSTMP